MLTLNIGDTAGSMSAPELTSLHSFLSMTPLTIFFLKSKAPVIFLALLFFERREELAISVCIHINIYVYIYNYLPISTWLTNIGSERLSELPQTP